MEEPVITNESTITLADVCEFIIDSEHKTAPTQDSGYPYVRTPNVGRGRIIIENMRFISEEIYRDWTRRGIPKPGDLILAREAPVGNAAIITKGMKPCLGQRTVLLRPNQNFVDPNYLVYFLLGDYVQGKFHGFSIGATVPHLNMSDIRGLKLPKFPELQMQRTIGSILSAYDSLIENNRRRIQLLDEMTRTLYREWFVHFRFPGHEDVELVDSELGEIPEGWRVSTIGKECNITAGQSPKSEYYNEEGDGLPFHQGVKDFGDYIPNHRVFCIVEKRVAKPGDILFSVRAPVGRINLADTKLIVGRGLFAISHKGEYQTQLLYQLKSIFYKEDMIGGGTVFQAVTKSDVSDTKILVPTDNVLRQFENRARSMIKLLLSLVKLNQVLKEYRDTLLPKLVSGQLDVSDMKIEMPPDTHKTPKPSDQSTLDQWLDENTEEK